MFIWGDCAKGQHANPANGDFAQGRFVGKTNGSIENARIALRNFGPTTFESGGQIRCTGTTFRNNCVGVRCAPYQNKPFSTVGCIPVGILDDVATLNGCKFITDDDYPLGLLPFEAFIRLNGVRGIRIWGPDCSNTKTNVICDGTNNDECYGYGIQSDKSGFRVQNSFQTPGGSSKFTGLIYGIHTTLTPMTKPITINGAIFRDCYKGIYGSHTTGIDISACKFYLGKLPNPAVSDRQFGSILYQTTVYRYRGNKAYGPPINVEKTIGTCVNDCGDLNNVVFRNTYDNVMIGNVANLTNAGGSMAAPRGLLYECNLNNSVYGFDFTQPTAGDLVRRVQGIIPSAPADPFRAAGNKFSYNPAVLESDFSYHGGGILDYRYLPDNPHIAGDEAQQPLDFVGLVTTPALENLNCYTGNDLEQNLLSGTELQNEKNRYYTNRISYLQANANHASALQSGNTTLAAQYLERAAHNRFEMDESASEVLYSLMRDTLNPQRDSMRRWMLNLETFGADLAVVLDDLDVGETTQAQTAYNAIPNRYTLNAAQQQDFIRFGTIVSVLSTQSMNTLDSTAQQTLLSIAQQTGGFAAQTAKLILSQLGFQFASQECTLPECCQFGQRGSEREQIEQLSPIRLRVYPNPATTEVTFDLPRFSSLALLKTFDPSGNLVWVHEFHSRAVWPTEGLPTGLYYYTLSREGEKTLSGKVSIIH